MVLSAALVSAAAGCSESTGDPAFTVRDSAGVRVAVSTAARWNLAPAERWTVGDAPVLDLALTGSGPDHEFYRVADALTLSDGRIVIANSGSYQVRVYAPDGSSLGSIGREGEGPGEFQRFFNIDAFAGDSLLVHTYPGRMTVLDPELEFVRTFDLGALARRMQAWDAELVGTVGVAMEEFEGDNALIRPPLSVVRFDVEGVPLDTVMRLPGTEAFFFMTELGLSGGRPLFAKTTVVAAAGEELLVGLADSLAFSVYGPDAALRRIVRVEEPDLRLTDEEIDAELEARVGPDPDRFTRDMHDALPIPATRAAYEDLLVDSTGHVWASTQPSWRDRREMAALDWNVFTPDGEWLGAVEMPARFRPLEIGADYVLGVRYDEMDVEHVLTLPLSR